jgi:signal peptidase II
MSNTKISWRESGWRWLWVSALVIGIDQITKLWIVATVPFKQLIYVLPVLDITYTVNPGAAFSFLAGAGGWQRWAFTLLAVGVSVGLLVWLRYLAVATHLLLIVGLTLILGGAVGNVIDRIEHGHVVDFVHLHWGNASFPAFNVADCAITFGAICVILDAIFESRRAKRAALSASKPGTDTQA